MNGTASTRNASRNDSAGFAFGCLLAGNICLAFGPWLVRLAGTDGGVGPVAAGFWRLALAAPVLMLLARGRGGGPKGAGAVMLALGGIFFAADLAAWHLGIERTKLANATLFGNAASFLFPIYGFLAARMLPSRSQAAALALAAAGAVLLLGQSYELSPQNLVGDLLSLLAGIFYTVYLVAIDTARRRLDPWRVLAFTTVAGLVPMLLFAHLLGEAIWPRAWWSLAGLAVVSQLLGQGFLVYAMGHVRPVVVGVAFLLQPIMSAVIGWVVYAEAMGTADLVGASAIAAAIVLVRRGSAEGGSLEVALKDAKDEA